MNGNKLTKWQYVCVILLLVCCTAVAFYNVSQKAYLHGDEIYSLGLSNSKYLPFFSPYLDQNKDRSFSDIFSEDSKNTIKYGETDCIELVKDFKQPQWKTSNDIMKYLTVQKGEKFNYLSVLYNQALDVHPPFYYLFVHTISSLFPNVFSKYILFSVNLIFYIATVLLIYVFLKKYFGFNTAFATALFYGLSIGAISTVAFFRMYMILTFWVVLSIFIHLHLEKNNWEFTKRRTLALVAVTVLGFYTHYYYIIFAAFIALISVIIMIKSKQLKTAFRYISRLIISGIISLIIWPFSAIHIFFGYRGTEVLGNSLSSKFISEIKNFYGHLRTAFFAGNNVLILTFFLMIGICILTALIKKKYLSRAVNKFYLMIVPAFSYTIIVSIIVSFLDIRYIMCFFPMFAFLFVYALKNILKTEKPYFLIVLIIILGISPYFASPNYVYKQDTTADSIIGETENLNCLYFYEKRFNFISELPDFTKREKDVLFLNKEQVGLLKDDEKVESSKEMVVYISGLNKLSESEIDVETKKLLDEIIENTHFENYEYLTQRSKSSHKSYIYKLY